MEPDNSTERTGAVPPPAAGGPRWRFAVAAATLPLAGCTTLATLAPAGAGAQASAQLFWWMAGAGALIWLGVMVLLLFSLHGPRPRDRRLARRLVIGGGLLLPTLLLTALLVPGLGYIEATRPPDEDPAALRIAVIGERWWWRVRYPHPQGRGTLESANELRLPLGERTVLELTSPEIIHSFWVPALAGKLDMIPGRVTYLTLEPTRPGTFEGACAEYCGSAHALMRFRAVVMERPAFDAWLAHEAQGAAEPPPGPAAAGRRAFLANGCGACHSVRGTPADGLIGPDLTHVGGRLTLGAGILPNRPEAMRRWISATGQVKPGVLMPHFGMLPEPELAAISAWLESLR